VWCGADAFFIDHPLDGRWLTKNKKYKEKIKMENCFL
jgi:hypothetical protein